MDDFKIEAVAFDMDGLMFDTERVAIELWMAAGAVEGWKIGLELLKSFAGQPEYLDRQRLIEVLGPDFPYDSIVAKRLDMEAEYFLKNEIPIKPGLVDIIAFFGAKGLPMAVATSTPRYRALPLLGKAEVLDCFAFALCGDEVTNPKPSPEIYLKAARKFGVAPGSCLVFEDSRAGIAAASAAGTIPVMIPDQMEPDEAARSRAARVFGSLSEVRDWLARAAVGSA
ncbi:MAG TPA: HAD family phosphatase [Rectinemataceae bacterium]|nr:HAD family phosphatase [Rectinemataceae bacterium]